MTKQHCDRCGAETTGVQSAHVMGVDDADEDGNGTETHGADLCLVCYAALVDWLKPAGTVDAEDRKTREVPGVPLRAEDSSS